MKINEEKYTLEDIATATGDKAVTIKAWIWDNIKEGRLTIEKEDRILDLQKSNKHFYTLKGFNKIIEARKSAGIKRSRATISNIRNSYKKETSYTEDNEENQIISHIEIKIDVPQEALDYWSKATVEAKVQYIYRKLRKTAITFEELEKIKENG